MVTPIRSVESSIKDYLNDEVKSTLACGKLNKIVNRWLAEVNEKGNKTVTLQELDADYELETANLARNTKWLRDAVLSHPGYSVTEPSKGATTGGPRPRLTKTFTITKTAAGATPPSVVPEVKS